MLKILKLAPYHHIIYSIDVPKSAVDTAISDNICLMKIISTSAIDLKIIIIKYPTTIVVIYPPQICFFREKTTN
jgi:hypothetical protein